jgi:hypothetical protein
MCGRMRHRARGEVLFDKECVRITGILMGKEGAE